VCSNSMSTCSGAQPYILTESTASMILSCSACSSGNNLNGFCVASCGSYFMNANGCSGNVPVVAAGNCNLPINDNTVCIAASSIAVSNSVYTLNKCLTAGYYL